MPEQTPPDDPSDEFDVVIPTVGRASLADLLESLAAAGAGPGRLVVVDDRKVTPCDLPAGAATVIRSGGRGPAAARNAGFAVTTADWVVFLDDDVVVAPGWARDLTADLREAEPGTVAVTGSVRVPRPRGRRPTDWERNVARLADARWITADLAVRREAFEAIGGFDECFRRAYREDSDLALRLLDAGGRIGQGRRRVEHPVREAGPLVSVRLQAGNADDVLLAAKHGPAVRERLGEPPSRVGHHRLVTAALLATIVAAARRHRRVALATGLWWCAATLAFAARRIAPGPRNPAEVATMLVTSAFIPPAATAHDARARVQVGRRRVLAGVRR